MSIRPTTKHDIQRDEENITRPGFDVVTNLLVSGSISMSSTGTDQGTGQVVLFSPTDGWIVANGTWSCISTDSPIFNVSVTSMITGSIEVGDRVWLSQSSQNKYFLVHGVGVTGSISYLTLYGGTDYSLITGSSISSPYYSHAKSPFGFPTNSDKWTVSTIDTNNNTQATPAVNTWYNLGNVNIIIPIGVWSVSYQCALAFVTNAAQTAGNAFATLSTANNSESDKAFTGNINNGGASATLQGIGTFTKIKTITLTTKTTYYLNARTTLTNMASLTIYGSGVGDTAIRAVSVYL